MALKTTMAWIAWTLFALVAAADSDISFKHKCLNFKPQLQNATLNRLERVKMDSTLNFPYNDPSCNRPSQFVTAKLCRVALSVQTSERSGFEYELWLPKHWNGRTLATGNGGLDGCIRYEDLAYGTKRGFASFGTNNGHNGTSGVAFFQNEDTVTDFSWRALHTSVELGKELASQFYGEKTGKSYYLGCSLGGRQGIGSAEKFPEDFDGIVAGAPAVDFNSLYSWRASFFPITGAVNSSGFISPDTWQNTIRWEVLRQCDTIDGVTDGIIEDPVLCHVDTERLLCGYNGSNSTDCLSAAQVEVVKTIYGDYLWPNGTLLYPRPNPGNELLASDGLYSGNPYGPSADWFKYAILENPWWDPATYTKDDALLAVNKNPADIDSWPTSLAPFQARGGKILTYHGQQDQQISSLNSIRFWNRLATGMGYDASKMDEFYRLFRIAGMNHCASGPGAWNIGQGDYAPWYPLPDDGKHNVLAAIVDWVEKGVAPDEIVGTKMVNDAGQIDYQHRHCRYPYRSTFSGKGDPLKPTHWHCVNFGGYPI
ncbi:feruloyl esterase B [Xylaria scruposa]|nr:feruloyl esterase B [Xylaria scruposa]